MNKIMVVNRGEIAVRVLTSIKNMGIRSVAVFSEADRKAPFVKIADESVCIGPALSSESYLNIDNIIHHAKRLNCDGIHPGYGFLSENAEFAKAVEIAGITFIGPKPHAIEVMGNKLAAKAAVSNDEIPMVPGTEEPIKDINRATEIAEDIGFPILIKAAAGGGGKGMRIVRESKNLKAQMERAISEAQNAFGNGAVFIEKFIDSPRHIEIQILADTYGKIIHLNERECSIQRRHQKVIEEAPSLKIDEATRKEMGETAIRVAKACNYVGAGTVEFLTDKENNFYFLEMNTRLQVEHPVTELITGVDLVEEQIRIARGEHLRWNQNDISIQGHSIELRVYAENPYDNFLPSIGTLLKYKPPQIEGVRVDDGMQEGLEIPIYYDPMISKLIVHEQTREKAISKMKTAIQNYQIEGVETTLSFGLFVMKHQEFISGEYDTQFVDQYFTPEAMKGFTEKEERVAALMALHLSRKNYKTISESD
ncbi:MAG TPA: acetyl-CoA carboxylase biotin carboxylase subunit [Bacteroidales bacterium]|nr:acetyl-CoA carboxylase biotin carboxylase subunit [Bacteroidales bacterium]